MEYFLLLPNDSPNDLTDENLLGTDNGFGVFWSGPALKILMSISEHHTKVLEVAEIRTSNGNIISIEEFLKKIEKLKVRYN